MEDAVSMLKHYAQRRSAARRCLVTLNGILQCQPPIRRDSDPNAVAIDPTLSEPRPSLNAPDFVVGNNDYQPSNNFGWAMTADDMQNAAVFGYFSDAWLTQAPMDNFDLLGI